MCGTQLAHAQQATSLRPSLADGLDDLYSISGQDSTSQSANPDQLGGSDGQSGSDVRVSPIDQAYIDSALLPPPPPGGIPPVSRRAPASVTTDTASIAPIDPYAPLGLRLGGLIAYPSIGVTGTYSDNVMQSPSNAQADFGLRIAPELRLQSDWVRHSYSLNAQGEFIFYDKNPDFDEQNANITSALQLDLRRTTTLDFTARYNLSQTSPSSSEVPDAASGQRRDQEFGFEAELTHRMNRVTAEVSAGARYLLFDDVDLAGGGLEDNTDRNYVEPSLGLRLSYQHTPAVRPFAELRYEPRLHDQSVDRSGLRRNSHGGTLSAGVAFNLSPIWTGEIALTYDVRRFDDPSLGTVHSGGIDANVTWRPSELTTVTWTATSDLEESADASVSAVRNYASNVQVAHALRDNLTISAGTGISYNDRIGSSHNELFFDAEAAISYLISRNVELLARYNFTGLDSGAPDSDYIENQFTAGFRYRL